MTASRSALPATAPRRYACPIAGALDVLGDRWTLLVVRDLFAGKRRYGEFQESEEGIPTNLLADRLARLESAGLVARAEYQRHPPRYDYRLTQAGLDLAPLLGAAARWGRRHLPGTRADPKLEALLRRAMKPESGS